MSNVLKRADSHGSENTLFCDSSLLERPLGETEVSYFLPSREDGVNDMYLHLGFRAPSQIMERGRARSVWSFLRLKHPLLASKVEMRHYDDIKFVYTLPESVTEAIESADSSLEYRSQSKDGIPCPYLLRSFHLSPEMIDTYLNGPRTLSTKRLSYLVISQQQTELNQELPNFGFMLCAAHFIGDGLALHNFANDFFSLLASDRTDGDLECLLTDEWYTRWGENKLENSLRLPSSLEDRLPHIPDGKFHRAVRRVDHENSQAKLIGGHSFPRRHEIPRKTVTPTVSIDAKRTKLMLKKCKAQSVSISSALFSIVNIAWGRTCDRDWELPIMMYSALNLRPVLTASKALNDSYCYLAIGYFNVVLPSFYPKSGSIEDIEKMFWHRARAAKNQSTRAAKTPLLVPRSHEMARERGQRARMWACEDDEKVRGTWNAPPSAPAASAPPSTALIGLSLLGNLDVIYKHNHFPGVQLQGLTTGSRQRAGGILLFGYTFAGRLWISLGYDQAGFDDTVERFWENVLSAVDTLLV
ncbi:hypothetical protein B0H14DRAFT_3728571 [Mycena olivaceomarginata]|nr:hypothetical protein B0H14DRAFT_3728571 [Mycena olivaceomarginata]